MKIIKKIFGSITKYTSKFLPRKYRSLILVVLLSVTFIIFNGKSSIAATTDYKSTYPFLYNMICEIFGIVDPASGMSLSNPSSLLIEMCERTILIFDTFSKTSLYTFFIGFTLALTSVGFWYMFFNDTALNYYEEDDLNNRTIKYFIKYAILMLLIAVMKEFVNFILIFFRYILRQGIIYADNIRNANVISVSDVNATTILNKIVNANNLTNPDNSILTETMNISKEMSLRLMYIFPWLIIYISKVGIVFAIFTNTIMLAVHSFIFIIGCSDLVIGIRNSRFSLETVTIAGLGFKQLLIIVVILIADLISKNYIKVIIDNVNGGTVHTDFLEYAFLLAAIQGSKLAAIIGCDKIIKVVFNNDQYNG